MKPQIIEATIEWKDDGTQTDVLFGVNMPDYNGDWEHEIFIYLDYPDEIEEFTSDEDFIIINHEPPYEIEL